MLFKYPLLYRIFKAIACVYRIARHNCAANLIFAFRLASESNVQLLNCGVGLLRAVGGTRAGAAGVGRAEGGARAGAAGVGRAESGAVPWRCCSTSQIVICVTCC